MEKPGEERAIEAIFEVILTENFPKINVRHQIIDPRSSENTKKNKCKKKENKRKKKKKRNASRYIIYICHKIKNKEKKP